MRKLFSKTSAAFTMAEILLSLTIIGVVAAITLPSLTGNINERTWATQKKALYARMSQAIPLLDSMNTYTDAESFIAGALNTVTKINNVCSQANIEDCGINKESLGPLADGTPISFPDTWSALGIDKQFEYDSAAAASNTSLAANVNLAQVAAFETGNGESIVLYYNPDCVPDQEQAPNSIETETNAIDMFDHVCINMIYDLNNNKGPNTVGKDIGFMTVFYPTDSTVVAPVPHVQDTTLSTTVACDSEYRVPNKFEAAALALNGKLIKSSGENYLTSSKGATGTTTYTYWQKALTSGELPSYTQEGSVTAGHTRCVKR